MLAQRMMEFDKGEAADVLAEYGVQALPRVRKIAPSARFAGRVLCHPTAAGAFSAEISDGTVDPRILKAQVISAKALAKLHEDPPAIVEFLDIREREINKVEDERFEGIVERLLV